MTGLERPEEPAEVCQKKIEEAGSSIYNF